jgi:hypothetical protein
LQAVYYSAFGGHSRRLLGLVCGEGVFASVVVLALLERLRVLQGLRLPVLRLLPLLLQAPQAHRAGQGAHLRQRVSASRQGFGCDGISCIAELEKRKGSSAAKGASFDVLIASSEYIVIHASA